MERQPGWWRRASVLVSLAAALVAAGLTWWVVTEGGPTPQPVAGAGGSGTLASQPGEGAAAPGATAPAGPTASAEPTAPVAPTASAEPGRSAQPSEPSEPSEPAEQAEPADGAGAGGQARAMNEVLARSNASHSGLTEAIVATSQCRRSGLDRIVDITAGRRDQLAAARGLAVDALPDGAALRKSLVAALDASFDADAAFLSWARRHVAGGCSGPVAEDRDYRRGLARSEDARKAKARFADAWRTVAKAHDLPEWRADQI
ncbi:hypothetical protein Nocox_11510 [Nonomuraea coxensis DSM 45129]|uniref:DUF4439 domain-containing protein n=1 Tax=Nonomuraea coxensis DSM 45129 TaxID=1122611 RepID=A0ABX8TX99_9ACTN|nr:hypothetical protein [Nonomuraea coxensis]QYC39920.1 hypothetical protein Nocox_11510 [Nonomuraea coxensis DSM 45129]